MKNNNTFSSCKMMPPLPSQPKINPNSQRLQHNSNANDQFNNSKIQSNANQNTSFQQNYQNNQTLMSFSNNAQQDVAQNNIYAQNNIRVPSDYDEQNNSYAQNQEQLFQSLGMSSQKQQQYQDQVMPLPQSQYNNSAGHQKQNQVLHSQRGQNNLLYSSGQKSGIETDSAAFMSCNNQMPQSQLSKFNPGMSQQNQRMQSMGNVSHQLSNPQQFLNSGNTSFRTANGGGPQSLMYPHQNDTQSRVSQPVGHHQQRPSMYMDIQKEIEELKNFDDIFQDSQRKISAPTPNRNFMGSNFNQTSQQKPDFNMQQPYQDVQQFQQPFNQFEQTNSSNPKMSNNQNMNYQNYQNLLDPPILSGTGRQSIQNPFENTGYSQQNKGRELLTITVDISEDQQENILIRENDDPFQLASEFAAIHGLNDQLRDLLGEQIKMNMEQVLQEDEQVRQRNMSEGTQQLNQYLVDNQNNQNYDNNFGNINQNQWETPMMPNQMNQNQVVQQQYQDNNYQSNDIAEYAAQHDSFQRSLKNTDSLPQTYQNHMLQNNQFMGEAHDNNPWLNPNHNKNQSFNLDEQYNNRSGMLANATGISGIVNQSYLTDRSGFNSNKMWQQPGSQGYQQWRQNVENKMQLIDERQNHPKINDNSKKMIEQKRQNSSASKNNSVHSRLHQQAISKQRSQQRQQQLIFEQNQQLTKNKSFIHNSGQKLMPQSTKNKNTQGYGFNSGRNINAGINRSFNHSNQSSPLKSNHKDPVGQLQLMKQKNQQAFNNQRPNSLQNAKASGISTIQSSDRNHIAPLPKPIINYGERLYQKGIKRKEELDRHIREAKNYIEQTEQDHYTFQPSINPVSRSIPRNEDALLKYGQQVREKIEQKRTEILLQEQAECRFRPLITKKSSKLLSERQHHQDGLFSGDNYDKFSNLYEDAKRRKERQDKIYSACIESECTFQPNTEATKFYNHRLENRDPNRTLSGQNRGTSRERSQKQIRENDLFDDKTGQPLFKPKVGRAPKNQQRPNPRDQPEAIGIHLYDQSKLQRQKYEDKKKQIEDEKEQKSKMVFTQDRTNRLVEKMKIQKFSEIFKQLDSDGDGQISANRIDISKLSPDLLEVFTPLFCEMEEMGQSLDEEEFIDAAGRLYDSIPLPQKNVILQIKNKWNDKSKMQEDTTFKPQLNPNSLRIAAKNRPQADVAEILIKKKYEYNQKVYEKIQEKENMELVGCTFHPKILQSPQSEGANSSRVYRSSSKGNYVRNPLTLNHSQQNLDLSNLNNSNNYGFVGNSLNKGVNNSFDINNLAQNIANELYSKQQQQQNQVPNNQYMSNMMRGSQTSNNLSTGINNNYAINVPQQNTYASSGNLIQNSTNFSQNNFMSHQNNQNANYLMNQKQQQNYISQGQMPGNNSYQQNNAGFQTFDPSSVNYGSGSAINQQDLMSMHQMQNARGSFSSQENINHRASNISNNQRLVMLK